jgi:3-oxoacyl-[acyl-carrier-protein] synthase-3
MFKVKNISVTHIACAVPQNKVDKVEWIKSFAKDEVERTTAITGINSLRRVQGDVTTIDLALAAVELILNKHPEIRSEIDGIIFASQTFSQFMPSTAILLHKRLGLSRNVFAIDMNSGCAAYPNAIGEAAGLIASGIATKVLVVTADTLTRFIDPNDRATLMVFGDGAAATIVEVGNHEISGDFMVDGNGEDKIYRNFAAADVDDYVHMNGLEVLKFTLTEIPDFVLGFFAKSGLNPNSAKDIVFHQANRLIVEKLAEKVSLLQADCPIVVDGFGNTGPSSIPIAICASTENKVFGVTAFVGFGVGWSWGIVLTDLKNTTRHAIVEI